MLRCRVASSRRRPGPATAAVDSPAATLAQLSAGELADRDAGPVSRSEDRRAATDPAKEAALAQTDGPAMTRTESLSEGDPRDIARGAAAEFGFSSDQFSCLDSLWTKESGWSTTADNPSSSAYGIPQALPGSKMSSAGSDWATNPVTQIRWGLGYIQDRYGSPCSAWGHSQSSQLVLTRHVWPLRLGHGLDVEGVVELLLGELPALHEPHRQHGLADRRAVGERLLDDLRRRSRSRGTCSAE